MEGQNQPDLLNILRKHRADPAPALPPSQAAPVPSAPDLSRALSEAGPRPGRGTRRDAWILLALILLVGGLIVAVMMKGSGPSPARTPPPGPAAAGPARPPAPPPSPPAKPAAAGTVKILAPAPAGAGKSFNTLMLVTYPGSKLAEAQATCAFLRSKDADFRDIFLYKANQQLSLCVGRFERPYTDAKAQALFDKARRMPNAQGRREFETCIFTKLTVLE